MFDNRRGHGEPGREDDDGNSRRMAPGKRTLTQRLARSPSVDAIADAVVQRLARGTATPDDPAAIAATGVASGGSPLPHLDVIQRSFGRHDVSDVSTHQGGAASDAARALDAQAYAFDGRIAFDWAPDLHTSAHEAAHVVQQRGGVQLKGAVSEPGDPHEVHADAVADAVVRGESAEALLDQYAGGGGSSSTGVQRLVRAEGERATATVQRLLGTATAAEADALRTALDRAITDAGMVALRMPVRATVGGEDYDLTLDVDDMRTLRDECVIAAMRVAPEPAAPEAARRPPVAAGAADADLAQQVTAVLGEIPSWIQMINDRVNPLTSGGQLVDIDPTLTAINAYYGTARSNFDTRVAAGAAVEAREMAFVQFVLGFLPQLGDIAGMMAGSTSFAREVEVMEELSTATLRARPTMVDAIAEDLDLGAAQATWDSAAMERAATGPELVPLGTTRMETRAPELAGAIAGEALSGPRGDAASRTMAPLTDVGPTPTVGETGDRFSIRAQQSKIAALRALLQCAQTGSQLAQIANQAASLPAQLAGAEVSDEARQLAQSLIQLRAAWPNMLDGIQALTRGVATARERVTPLATAWSPAQLEVYLWLLWMAALGDDSWHIHPDVIENRLSALGIIGASSITGVDFGELTTVFDTAEAVQAARGYQRSILAALETYGALRLGGPG